MCASVKREWYRSRETLAAWVISTRLTLTLSLAHSRRLPPCNLPIFIDGISYPRNVMHVLHGVLRLVSFIQGSSYSALPSLFYYYARVTSRSCRLSA